jgi:hypothetical protein
MGVLRFFLLGFSGFLTEEPPSGNVRVRYCAVCGYRLSRYNRQTTCSSHTLPDPQAETVERAVAGIAEVFGVSEDDVFTVPPRGKPVLRHCLVYLLKELGFSHMEIFEFLPDDAACNTGDQYRAWERKMCTDALLKEKTMRLLQRLKEP